MQAGEPAGGGRHDPQVKALPGFGWRRGSSRARQLRLRSEGLIDPRAGPRWPAISVQVLPAEPGPARASPPEPLHPVCQAVGEAWPSRNRRYGRDAASPRCAGLPNTTSRTGPRSLASSAVHRPVKNPRRQPRQVGGGASRSGGAGSGRPEAVAPESSRRRPEAAAPPGRAATPETALTAGSGGLKAARTLSGACRSRPGSCALDRL